MPRGRRKKLENEQLCKLPSAMTTLTSVAVADVAFVKATPSLTRHGRLYNEVLVVGKQFGGVLFYWSFL